jgi:hypothetical protein
LERGGTQQASHVIGAERGLRSGRDGFAPLRNNVIARAGGRSSRHAH